MPQATEDLRNLMREEFGSIDMNGPQQYLVSKGYKITDDWRWIKPDPLAPVPLFDFDCVDFLIKEWDFGGFADPVGDVPK